MATLTDRQARELLMASLILAVAGLLILPFDMRILDFVQQYPPRGEFQNLLQRSEAFGHGTGVALILITIVVLCRPGIRTTAWLAAATYGAGMAANLIKVFVVRTRPHSVDEVGASALPGLVDVISAPFTNIAEHIGNSSEQSFPSAHTATAFGLAVAIGTLFPRGRIWFLVLGGLVGCQRICASCHFPSDVCWGAAVGIAFGVFSMRQLAQSGTEAPVHATTTVVAPDLPREAVVG
ncbi:MAG: phosphatase PAP2 family protein [Planctomycetota bacterium]